MTTPVRAKARTVAFDAGPYHFRPIEPRDLKLVERWASNPHVVEWWGDAAETLKRIGGDIGADGIEGFIVAHEGTPFAYVQAWDVHFWGDFFEEPEGSLGLDPFIGEPDMLGKGHGSAFIAALAAKLLEQGAPRILIDPDPDNTHAIRAYERAGFVPLGKRQAQDGTVWLMARDRAN